jgi:hypothetical protein
VDLDRLRADLEVAVARRRRSEARRIDRRLVPMRTQLLTIEARLEELAAGNRKSLTIGEALAQHAARQRQAGA